MNIEYGSEQFSLLVLHSKTMPLSAHSLNKFNSLIENKIYSNINGKNGEESQLTKYYKIIKEGKYKEKCYSEFENYSCFFLIFCPDCKVELLKKEKNDFLYGNEYKVVPYSKIYNFYYSNKELFNDEYYLDFLNALYKHTQTQSFYYFDTLKKFFNATGVLIEP